MREEFYKKNSSHREGLHRRATVIVLPMMNQILKSVLGTHYQHVQHLWRRTKTAHTDPVCGMSVEPPAAGTSEYQGKTYWFCSPGCKAKFDVNPAWYAQKAK